MPGHLPRKAMSVARSNEAIRGVAYQIGVLLCIERNRRDWTQEDVGRAVGLDQVAISFAENGQPVGKVKDATIEAFFKKVGLDPDGVQCRFVKWWRDNG